MSEGAKQQASVKKSLANKGKAKTFDTPDGRSPLTGGSWWNDGINEYRLYACDNTEGLSRGMLPNPNKKVAHLPMRGKKWYNNGLTQIRVSEEDARENWLSKGYFAGRLKKLV